METSPAGIEDGDVNERVADAIEREWVFRLKRVPGDVVERVGLVVVILASLEALLVFSNNVQTLGLWEAFLRRSTQYRDGVTGTSVGRLLHLDTGFLNPYSLWRGWAVPSLLAGATYVTVALVTLRVELYHWKPELLAHYLSRVRATRLARPVPAAWLDRLFFLYEEKHFKYKSRRLQRRTHRALHDARALANVLRVVGTNIALSAVVLLGYWALFLACTGMESHDIARLPRSYVPPLQGLLWYLVDDCLYFYPHWIAHAGVGWKGKRRPRQDRTGARPPRPGPAWYGKLPAWLAGPLSRQLNQAHKLHHRNKANLGIAAWYCSPVEQVFFNLVPVLAGPFLTQVLADWAGCSDVYGTHLVTLYVWLMAGAAMSVLGHTGYRSRFNDPGKHDLHHERALDPQAAVNFGTMGLFDRLHGTGSAVPQADAQRWRRQRRREAALRAASRRTGIALTRAQQNVVQQPEHDEAWTGQTI